MTEPAACGQGQYQCKSGECIDDALRCDRAYNCADGSDELDCGEY